MNVYNSYFQGDITNNSVEQHRTHKVRGKVDTHLLCVWGLYVCFFKYKEQPHGVPGLDSGHNEHNALKTHSFIQTAAPAAATYV